MSEEQPEQILGTDWDRLREMSDEDVRKAIASDPDACAPDADFWKRAKVVDGPLGPRAL